MSNSLRPRGLQHARLPCPSRSPRSCSNSCLLSWWCHPTISSSVVPFSSCPQSFPASGSFQMSQLFTSGQSIGASATASVLPMNTQGWFPLGWTGFDLLAVQGTLQTLLQHHSSKASILWWSAFFMVQVSHPYMTIGKTIALTIFYSVQSLHCVRLFATPWTAAHPGLPVHHQILELWLYSIQFSHSIVSDSLRPHGLQHTQASLSITNSWSLLKLMSIKSVMPPNHLILCYPLLLLPSMFPSIRLFSNEAILPIRWPNIGVSARASVVLFLYLVWLMWLGLHQTCMI